MGFTNTPNIGNDDDDDQGNGGPGGGFPAGMTPVGSGAAAAQANAGIDDILIDYNKKYKKADPALFRDAVIDQTASVLIGRYKPNPLLVGSAGVGKTAIAEEIARRLAIDDAWVPPELKGSTIYELPLGSLVAGAGIVGELESRVMEIIDFAQDRSNKAILFIDEIHVIIGEHSETYRKIAQLLKPALARGRMKVIGATTLGESKSFDEDPAFSRRFTRLVVDELSREQTSVILHRALPSLVAHYKNSVNVAPGVLDILPLIADENSKGDSHRPDNALTLLDRSMADTRIQHSAALRTAQANGDTTVVQVLQSIQVLQVNERKARSTALRMMTGNSVKEQVDIATLTADLGRLKGQDEVLEPIVEMLKRDALGVFPRTRPITLMFVGPSGVGKTESAKILAKRLTGMEPIRLNMPEFENPSSLNRIIGSPLGYVGSESKAELPFDSLESNPYRVILLDEFEKAHRSVQQLFLTAIDEGWMQTAKGRRTDFSKTVIIATTNAGRDMDRTSVGFTTGAVSMLSQNSIVKSLERDFPPELLGRFTRLVKFNPLQETTYREIIESTYEWMREEVIERNARQGAQLPAALDDEILNDIVSRTYVPSQGARPALRIVRSTIEDILLGTLVPTPAAQQGDGASSDDEEQDGPGGTADESGQAASDSTDDAAEDHSTEKDFEKK